MLRKNDPGAYPSPSSFRSSQPQAASSADGCPVGIHPRYHAGSRRDHHQRATRTGESGECALASAARAPGTEIRAGCYPWAARGCQNRANTTIAILFRLLLPLLVVSSSYRPLLRNRVSAHRQISTVRAALRGARRRRRRRPVVVAVTGPAAAPGFITIVIAGVAPSRFFGCSARPAPTAAAATGPWAAAAAKTVPLASDSRAVLKRRFFREPLLALARARTMGSTWKCRASGSISATSSPYVPCDQ